MHEPTTTIGSTSCSNNNNTNEPTTILPATTGFAAIKAKWNQGANKFGTFQLPQVGQQQQQQQGTTNSNSNTPISSQSQRLTSNNSNHSTGSSGSSSNTNNGHQNQKNDLGTTATSKFGSPEKELYKPGVSGSSGGNSLLSKSYHVPSPTKSSSARSTTTIGIMNTNRYNNTISSPSASTPVPSTPNKSKGPSNITEVKLRSIGTRSLHKPTSSSSSSATDECCDTTTTTTITTTPTAPTRNNSYKPFVLNDIEGTKDIVSTPSPTKTNHSLFRRFSVTTTPGKKKGVTTTTTDNIDIEPCNTRSTGSNRNDHDTSTTNNSTTPSNADATNATGTTYPITPKRMSRRASIAECSPNRRSKSSSSNNTNSNGTTTKKNKSKRSAGTSSSSSRSNNSNSSNKDFDGYASYSSSDGNLSISDYGNMSYSESMDILIVDENNNENHTNTTNTNHNNSNNNIGYSNNQLNNGKTSTPVRSLKITPNNTTTAPTTAGTAIQPPRLGRKASSGRDMNSNGNNIKKQAVIYTRQVQTIMDLPVFVHTDHEEDMILQALYNKEDLFSQLRVGQLKQFVSAFELYKAPAGDIIIHQGDPIHQSGSMIGQQQRDHNTSYFYVIHRGIVEFTVDDQHVGTAGVGESFGEFALLYNTPRSATVLALEDVELFRVDALTFRRILSAQTQLCTHKKCRLIESIHFFEHIIDECHIADHVVTQAFRQGDVLLRPDERNNRMYIIGEGVIHRKTKSTGRTDTLAMKPGDYFGERALIGNDTSASTYVAASRGLAFTMDRSTFDRIVMKNVNPTISSMITTAILNDQMIRRLALLQFMIQYAEPMHVVMLASHLKDKTYRAGDRILIEKENVRASLYYVKQGVVTISPSDSTEKVIPVGGWFGEAHMIKAYSKGKKTTKCIYSVTAKTDCICSVLTLKDFVSVVAPMNQSSNSICPEPTTQPIVSVPMEQIEEVTEVTESGFDSVIIVPSTLDSMSIRPTPATTPVVVPIGTDDLLTSSKHDEKPPSKGYQRQPSDSSTATATSNIFNTNSTHVNSCDTSPIVTSRHKSEVLITKPVVTPPPPTSSPTTTITTATTAGPAPQQQQTQVKPQRKLPVKRQRQLSFVQIVPLSVKLHQLQKHTILGEGTFGIVWLVSDPTNQKETKYYALKKQSKAFLIGENQVEAVIQEKIMLENMRHPFLVQLEKTYQDEYFIYTLLEFVQGGELFTLMHETDDETTMPEYQAKFYALCLADVLDYLRNRKYVYRDLKGENVMLDAKGYVKLIDFGFCKYLLADKTYTLCGTPGYLSPEMVTMQGHGFSTDNWSLGVLIYEMIAGCSPFYYDGIDQIELFDSIAQNEYPPLPDTVSMAGKDLVAGLLRKDPIERYGSKNQCVISTHEWFNELDLDAMRHREMVAPWVPILDGPLDTSNFNDWSELEQADNDGIVGTDGDLSKKGLVVSKRDQKLFEGVF